jgi:hypothetical protein
LRHLHEHLERRPGVAAGRGFRRHEGDGKPGTRSISLGVSKQQSAQHAASIKKDELLQKIVIDKEGQILVGRNRFAACEVAGVEPEFDGLRQSEFFCSERRGDQTSNTLWAARFLARRSRINSLRRSS